MKKAMLAIAMAVAFAVPATGGADTDIEVGEKGNGWSKCEELYLERYPVAFEKFGGDAVGRNLVDDGALRPDGSVEEITDARACEEAKALGLMLNPPPEPEPVAASEPVVYETEAAAPPEAVYSESTGGWAIPESIVMCESGGNYGALNPSGAGGAYQIMPETWANYGGTGLPHEASPAEQDAVAAAIYAAEGTDPWVCAG